MPQTYRGNERGIFGYEALLTKPRMAAYIGAVCVLWECIEEMWGVILAEALQADAKLGVDLYLALTGSAAQGAVMTRAIEHAVQDPELRAEFGVLLASERARAKERNRIVHGRWGVLPSRDDALVIGERNWLPKALATINHNYLKPNPAPLDIDYPVTIWTEQDFKQTLQRMDAFGLEQHKFMNRLERARHLRKQAALSESPEQAQSPQGPPARGLLSPPQTNPEERSK